MAARISSIRNGLPATEIIGASRDDLVLGDQVTLTSADAATTYSWILQYAPEGSLATFSGSPAAVSPGFFTVDKEGAYLIRLTVDAGLTTESTQYVRLRLLTSGLGLHLVSAGERRDTTGVIPVDVDPTGWADEQNANLLALEAAVLAVPPLADVLVAGNTTGGTNILVSAGDEIRGVGDLVLQSLLPGGNITLNPGGLGAVVVNGKLTVTGLIDPIGLVLSEGPAPGTAADEAAFFISNGAGGLVIGEVYLQPPSSGTPTRFSTEAKTFSGAPKKFVWRPGGTAGGNVYTDFAKLYAALGATEGLKELVFDDSLTTPLVIPAGTYDFAGTKWSSGGIASVNLPGGGLRITAVNFTAGTVITNLHQIDGLALFNTLPATSPIQYDSGTTVATNISGNSILASFPGAAPLMQVSGGTTLYLWLSDRSQIGGTNREAVELVGADTLHIEMVAGSQIKDDALKGALASSVAKISLDASCNFNTSQPLFLGAIPGLSAYDRAFLVEVDPAGLTHITSFDVQGALADLDGAITSEPIRVHITNTQAQDATSGPLSLGQFPFAANDYTSGYTYSFNVVLSVTSPLLTGTAILYNLTDGETVATLNTSATTPTKLQAFLTVGVAVGNLKLTEKIYEVRLSVSGALPTDIVSLGSAFLLIE